MKYILSFFMLLLMLTPVSKAAKIAQTFTSERPTGEWSQYLTAEPGDLSSSYGITKISFRQMKFTKSLNNCNCFWGRGCKRWICQWCDNVFNLMVNSVKVVFRPFNGSNVEVVKTFETGNTQSGVWRDVSCPDGQFVTSVANRLGNDQGQDLGVVGIQIRCQSLNSNQVTIVSDKYTYPLTSVYTPKKGNYLTALQFKYIKGGKITGIRQGFEPRVFASNFKISYSNPKEQGKIETIPIQTLQKSNPTGGQSFQSIAFTQAYQISNTWVLVNQSILNYGPIGSLVLLPPKLADWVGETDFKQLNDNVVFGTAVTTKFVPIKESKVMLPICYKVKTTSQLRIQKVIMPFQITYQLLSVQSKEVVSQSKAKGEFVGYRTGVVETINTFEQIVGCDTE